MSETIHPRIDRARGIVEEELTRVRAEAAAFSDFVESIERIEVSDRLAAGPGSDERTHRLLSRTASRDAVSERIASAYRRTVMGTPHYEEEYGDSVEESIGAEFGPGVASVLTSGSALTPRQYRAVVRAGEFSRTERERFATTLEGELDSLEGIETELADIERRAYELDREGDTDRRPTAMDDRERYIDLIGECEGITARRQRLIHNRSIPKASGIGNTSLVRYLYAGCEFRFPALADIADVVSDLREKRERAERELIR